MTNENDLRLGTKDPLLGRLRKTRQNCRSQRYVTSVSCSHVLGYSEHFTIVLENVVGQRLATSTTGRRPNLCAL